MDGEGGTERRVGLRGVGRSDEPNPTIVPVGPTVLDGGPRPTNLCPPFSFEYWVSQWGRCRRHASADMEVTCAADFLIFFFPSDPPPRSVPRSLRGPADPVGAPSLHRKRREDGSARGENSEVQGDDELPVKEGNGQTPVGEFLSSSFLWVWDFSLVLMASRCSNLFRERRGMAFPSPPLKGHPVLLHAVHESEGVELIWRRVGEERPSPRAPRLRQLPPPLAGCRLPFFFHSSPSSTNPIPRPTITATGSVRLRGGGVYRDRSGAERFEEGIGEGAGGGRSRGGEALLSLLLLSPSLPSVFVRIGQARLGRRGSRGGYPWSAQGSLPIARSSTAWFT